MNGVFRDDHRYVFPFKGRKSGLLKIYIKLTILRSEKIFAFRLQVYRGFMKNTVSLKKNGDFRYVYNRGKSLANRHLILYIYPNGEGFNRLGLSVSKKVGKSVVRNRVKRLIKESYRLKEKEVKPGYNLVFIARSFAKGASFSEISGSVGHLLYKHGLVKAKNG